MRRWFLARFYRLGFGSWFDPPTRYVDKAPTGTDVLGDEQDIEVLDGDLVFLSSPIGEDHQPVTCVGDDLLGSTTTSVPVLPNEVDP